MAHAASALEQLAASMAPGTWAKLTVSNQDAVLGVGGVSGSMVHYSNAMPWNPVTKKIEIIGMDHMWGKERYAQFDPATNSFVLVSADVGFGAQTRHGYDHTAVNPYTGVVYNRLSDIGTMNLMVRYTNSGSANFQATPNIGTVYDQIAIGATWWSGPFVGAGNQGAFIIFNSGDSNGSANDGQIVAWDPVKNSWIFNKRGMSPNYMSSGYTYHSVIKYSPQKNVAVYGGGNDAPTKLWRLNADGTFVSMPPVPSGKGVGIQEGNLVNDPVTGNFLLLSARQLWELNPDGSGTWTQKSSPPSGVGTPDAAEGLISASLSDYGVVAYITQTTSQGGTFYLYKNAASAPADAVPPTVSIASPAAGTVSGTVTLSANASDNTGVAGVQFKLDGVNLSAEDTAAPYSLTWDTTSVANGTHVLTAVARDAAGNQTTSASVTVTVSNAADTTPDAMGFTTQTGVAPGTVITSNTITPTGYNSAAAISVSAGASYSINGGAFVSTAGTINPGQTVAVRQTSASSSSTTTTATLTIGGVAGSFAVTTAAPDATPNAFGFATQTGVAVGTTMTSNTVTPAGYNTSVPISVSAGASYSINGGAFVTAAGTINPGQTVAVRQTSSASAGTTTTATLTIGGVAGTFSVTTQFAAGTLVTMGETNVLPISDSGNANLLIAQSTTLAQSASIQSLSFYVTAAAGNLRLGVYDATGPNGGPGAKVAETLEITPTVGWNTANVTASATLAAGTYWLAYLPSSNSLGFLNTADATSTTKYYSYTYGAMPATFSTAPNNSASHWSLYGTLALGPVTPDTTPDGFTFTAQTGVAANTAVTSNTVTPTGFNTATNISISAGASYSLNGGAFVTAAGTFSPGQTVAVRQTSSATIGATATAILTIGGVSSSFSVTTAAPDTAPDAFSFTAQTGSALNTAVTSNTVTPSGYNAAASISVSGGSYSINGGAFTSTAGAVTPGQTVAVRLTTSASNSTQTCASLTIGGVAGQFCATTQGTVVVGGQDFATRCAQPGVVKCVGFDDVADFNAATSASNSGIFPPSGTTDYTRGIRDTSVKASGGSSLRFTIPSNSPADTSGSYFTNFSDDLSVQFGANEEFYVQWRQRFSAEFLSTFFTGGYGWKQVIVGTGDQPGMRYYSCSTLELVPTNSYQRGFPQMYNSCTGSASHGPFSGFEEPYGSYDFKLQNARPAPYCLYSQSSTGFFPPNGNCFGYVANEWMTFQMRVQIGPRVGDEFQGSYITLWGAREGQPSEMLIRYGPYNLSAGSLAENQRYGKIWLTPYHTNKDSSQVHPTAYTWYDEVIISRNKIEDPPMSQVQQPLPDTIPDAFSFTAQTSAAPSAVATSNTITPAGYNTGTPISVSGGSYSINGGTFVTTAGTINPGQTVALRTTASSSYSTATGATLTIGGISGTFTVTTQAAPADTTPDAFSFTAQSGVATGATVTSSTITPSGFNAATAISVSGGSYSINGGAFVTTAGTLNPGQTVAVRLTASSANSTSTSATLTIGGVAGTFTVTTQAAVADTTPDAIGFTAQTGVAPGAVVTSNTITPTGYNAAAAISISGGSYSINGGAFVTTAGTLNPGQTVAVRVTASSANSTSTSATLTIGGVAGTFTVTTQAAAADTTPDAIGFTAQTGVAPGAVVTSNTITPTGFNAATAISVSGGSYSINGGAFVTTAGTLNPGQTVAVRLTASSANSTSASATLTIGGVAGTFTVTTQAAAADTAPDAFTFTARIDVPLGASVTSNTIVPTGFNAPTAISITGGSYSINGGAFVTMPGTINPGQSVAVRVLASRDYLTSTSATLTIGGVSATFTVMTKSGNKRYKH